jgi:hypothetical protein
MDLGATQVLQVSGASFSSGHRTRSIFDRYSLSLKAQTRAALRRVTAYTQDPDPTPTVIPVRRQGQRGGAAAVIAPAVSWPPAS